MDKAQQEACQRELSSISTVKKVLSTNSSVPVALVQYATELQPDFVCAGSRGLGTIQRLVHPDYNKGGDINRSQHE
eukprot:3396845-Pyramimonas_sp.AAC.1